MPLTSVTTYVVTVTAEVRVVANNEEAAMAIGKEALKAETGHFTWAIKKEVVEVITA